jgi:simple sugar transport system permease protein
MVLATCALGGAAAGLAGAIEIVAVHGFASSSLVVGFGYTGILTAFLARQHPLAIVMVAVLLGGISASGGLLQRRFGLPDAATLVLQGLLFMSVLAANTLYGRARVFRERPS